MAASSTEIRGESDPEFAEVRRVFAENFKKRGELGASVCVWHKGRKVVDLWGGHQDKGRTKEWQENTLSVIFSSTKGMVALCFLMLSDRGTFDYDDPVAKYWPEFAAAGKQDLTIRTLLNHRAGLVAVDQSISLDALESRPEEIASILAAQSPYWSPGTDQGYHGVTYGLYAAELFRRLADESLGSFLAREVSAPLGADMHLGLPASEENRVSPIYPAGLGDLLLKIVPKLLLHQGTEGRVYRQVVLGGEAGKAFRNPAELGPKGIENFNTARVRAMELPWANAVSNARGLARVYAALAHGGAIDGVRLVSADAIAPIIETQSWSKRDRVLRKPQGWSQGFIKEKVGIFAPDTQSFGHPGAGGALGWCDPGHELAIGYTPNNMAHHIRSPRARALTAAVYGCVGS